MMVLLADTTRPSPFGLSMHALGPCGVRIVSRSLSHALSRYGLPMGPNPARPTARCGAGPQRSGDLSTMTPGELLEPDLTDRTEFVGTYDRLPADECAEIQMREVLSASRAQ